MIATKVERDPIYHLTGGKFAQDAKAKATYEQLLWKRIWTWSLYTGPFWIILAIWYRINGKMLFKISFYFFSYDFYRLFHIYNNWELQALGLSGKTDILIEKELDSIVLNPKYGQKMFTDEMYRKVFKSECLKKYGLEEGTKIYKEAVTLIGYKERKTKKDS